MYSHKSVGLKQSLYGYIQEQNLCSWQTNKKKKRNNLKSEDSCVDSCVNFFCGYFMFFCLVYVIPLCVPVYVCLVVTCWERADLLALVNGV